MRTHLVIPDVQAKPGVPVDHLEWLGQYIVDKQPHVIVCLADFNDLPSLCSYDVGKKSFEGRRLKADIEFGIAAMRTLMSPLIRHNNHQRKNHKTLYLPELHLTLGNHEYRIKKLIDNDPKLEGIVSMADLGYEKFGWTVHDFLQPVKIDGVFYSHYFCSGPMGRPITTAKGLLNKFHSSCFAGHQQGRDIAYGKRPDGSSITAIIAGSFYQHDEGYLNPQTNRHWKGFYVLHEVEDGSFDEMAVSLGFLKRKYG
jgi:hypothetical protein